jgi:hypothetical protein
MQGGIISNIAYHDSALFALATADGRNIDNNIHVLIIHHIITRQSSGTLEGNPEHSTAHQCGLTSIWPSVCCIPDQDKPQAMQMITAKQIQSKYCGTCRREYNGDARNLQRVDVQS